MNRNDQLFFCWEKARCGCVNAFNQIHEDLGSELHQYLLRFVNDEMVAQDLVQELFICMWEKKENLGSIKNVKAYFYKCSRSMAIHHKRTLCLSFDFLSSRFQEDFENSAEDRLISHEHGQECSKRIAAAVNSLPKRQREMISMKFYEGLEYEQISAFTGIKYQSVVNHVHRGINQLRNEINFRHFCAPILCVMAH